MADPGCKPRPPNNPALVFLSVVVNQPGVAGCTRKETSGRFPVYS
ncbi:mCG148236 [Mus musculus]|nr:mCG148236 [Mus musculus]